MRNRPCFRLVVAVQRTARALSFALCVRSVCHGSIGQGFVLSHAQGRALQRRKGTQASS
jgi:hypothetical protein